MFNLMTWFHFKNSSMASFLYGIIAIIYMTVFVVILVIISTILLKVLYAYYCPEISNPSYLPATYSTPCYILHLNYMGVVGPVHIISWSSSSRFLFWCTVCCPQVLGWFVSQPGNMDKLKRRWSVLLVFVLTLTFYLEQYGGGGGGIVANFCYFMNRFLMMGQTSNLRISFYI